jgi:hypothetical protein
VLKSPPTETPTTPLIAPKIPYAAALYDNIQRLKLDVRTIVPFHGARTADLAPGCEARRQNNPFGPLIHYINLRIGSGRTHVAPLDSTAVIWFFGVTLERP